VTTFRVLFVCTADHCRSPMAQQLLRQATVARFGAANTWEIDAAGTDTPGPWPLHDNAALVLAERLSSVADQWSRDITPLAIARADLILTATRHHRGLVVGNTPSAIGRTFTILQFARLCDQVAAISAGDAGELGRRLVIDAKLARSSLQPVPVQEDDLPDPMGRGLAQFRICADQLQDANARMLRPLELLS